MDDAQVFQSQHLMRSSSNGEPASRGAVSMEQNNFLNRSLRMRHAAIGEHEAKPLQFRAGCVSIGAITILRFEDAIKIVRSIKSAEAKTRETLSTLYLRPCDGRLLPTSFPLTTSPREYRICLFICDMSTPCYQS
ncbi:hypothetical protein EVAR_101988_1 [Eumeta japonica]|uniref:Uncharacterized protein n=1 Tax=Eumeta variegata TaxID=151549 RepID=A0A4C1TSJ1_EUMVA|nr:hypothetical protein EVAR_101988_1 [Eumeta japonica]